MSEMRKYRTVIYREKGNLSGEKSVGGNIIVRDVQHISGSLPKLNNDGSNRIPGIEYVKDPKSRDFMKPIIRNAQDVAQVEAVTGFRYGRAGHTQANDWDIRTQFKERGRA